MFANFCKIMTNCTEIYFGVNISNMNALDKNLKNVYLLSGEESFYIDKAREKIISRLEIEKSDLVTIDYNTKMPMSEVVTAIDSAPFFGDKNVVLVKNATFFNAEIKSDRLANILKNMQENNFVIFISRSTDKRRKLYKIISEVGEILEADLLRAWEIEDWLNEKLKSVGKVMYGGARKYFSERVGILPEISLYYLENEFDKISLAVNGREITADDLKRLLLDPPEVSNFALPDAIDEKKVLKAMKLLRVQLRDEKKFPLVLTVLVRHVRQLLRVKHFLKLGIRGRELAAKLEMNPYICKKVENISGSYPPKLLEEIFLDLADADFKLKFGRAGIEVLERIVVKLCKR